MEVAVTVGVVTVGVVTVAEKEEVRAEEVRAVARVAEVAGMVGRWRW